MAEEPTPTAAPAAPDVAQDADAPTGSLLQPNDPGASLLDWRSSLPENLRTDPVIQQFPTSEGAAKSLVHAQRMLGQSVQLPADDADAATWEKFYGRLGRPDTPDAYDVTSPEIPDEIAALLPEGVSNELDPEELKQAKEVAHALGLTPKQLQGMIDLNARLQVQRFKLDEGRTAQDKAAAERALLQEFGPAAPRKLQMAQAFFQHVGNGRFGGQYGQKAWEKIEASGLGNDPDFIATFSAAFELMGEDTILGGGEFAGVLTAETLNTEINQLMAQKVKGERIDEQRLQALYRQKAQFGNQRPSRV